MVRISINNMTKCALLIDGILSPEKALKCDFLELLDPELNFILNYDTFALRKSYYMRIFLTEKFVALVKILIKITFSGLNICLIKFVNRNGALKLNYLLVKASSRKIII